MRMPRFLVLLSVVPFLLAASGAPASNPDPEKVVLDAMARAVEIPRQADVLAQLAWPTDAREDPRVAAIARQKLVEFGEHGIPAVRQAEPRVKPEDQADVVKVLLEQFRRTPMGVPPDLVPTLDWAVWYGTREARLLAMPELARFKAEASMLAMVDAAEEDPEILPQCVEALGALGDDHARFFLERALHEGRPGVRESAAVALARIGGRARLTLQTAVRSKDRDVRLAAVRALLPVATVDDVTVFHEYVSAHADDDPATVKAATDAATKLEKLIDAQQAADSASPPPN